MSNAKVLLILAGVFEAILAIPILGGTIVMGLAYIPLVVMFFVHIIGLIVSGNEKAPIYGSITGIITSLIAWIPLLGWLMHLITAILLLVSAFTIKDKRDSFENKTTY